MKLLTIVFIVFIALFLIMAATSDRQLPPRPIATTVLTGCGSDIRDFVIQKTKEGYQVTHLSATSNCGSVVIMSKY